MTGLKTQSNLLTSSAAVEHSSKCRTPTCSMARNEAVLAINQRLTQREGKNLCRPIVCNAMGGGGVSLWVCLQGVKAELSQVSAPVWWCLLSMVVFVRVLQNGGSNNPPPPGPSVHWAPWMRTQKDGYGMWYYVANTTHIATQHTMDQMLTTASATGTLKQKVRI